MAAMSTWVMLALAAGFDVNLYENTPHRSPVRVHENASEASGGAKKASGNATESVEIGGPGSMKHHHKHKGDDDDNEGDKENDIPADIPAASDGGDPLPEKPIFTDFSKHYKTLGSFQGVRCRTDVINEVPGDWTAGTQPSGLCSQDQYKDTPNWFSNQETQETSDQTAPAEMINAWKHMQCNPGLTKVENFLSTSGGLKCAAFKNMELCVNANERNMASKEIFCINEDFTGYKWGFPEGNCCECGKGHETTGEIVTMKQCCELGYLHKGSLGCRLANHGIEVLGESPVLEDPPTDKPAATGIASTSAEDEPGTKDAEDAEAVATSVDPLQPYPAADRERMYSRYLILALFSTTVILGFMVYRLMQKQ